MILDALTPKLFRNNGFYDIRNYHLVELLVGHLVVVLRGYDDGVDSDWDVTFINHGHLRLAIRAENVAGAVASALG